MPDEKIPFPEIIVPGDVRQTRLPARFTFGGEFFPDFGVLDPSGVLPGFLAPAANPAIQEIVVTAARPPPIVATSPARFVAGSGGSIAVVLGFLMSAILKDIGQAKLDEEMREFLAEGKLRRNDTPLHTIQPQRIDEIVVTGRQPVPRLFVAPEVPFEIPLLEPLRVNPRVPFRERITVPARPRPDIAPPAPARTRPARKPQRRKKTPVPFKRPSTPLRRPSVPLRRPSIPIRRPGRSQPTPASQPRPETNPMVRPLTDFDRDTDSRLSRTTQQQTRPRMGTRAGTGTTTGSIFDFATSSPFFTGLTPSSTAMALLTGIGTSTGTVAMSRPELKADTRLRPRVDNARRTQRGCPPCKKDKKRKERRRECWKKLVKESWDPEQDESFNWVRINCFTGREL